jgi:hypothetical protein
MPAQQLPISPLADKEKLRVLIRILTRIPSAE